MTERFEYGDTVVARQGKSAIYGTYYGKDSSYRDQIAVEGSRELFTVATPASGWKVTWTLEHYTPTVAEVLDKLAIGGRFRMNNDVEGTYYMKASSDAFVHVDTSGAVSTASHRRSNFSDDERIIVVKG